MRLDSKQLNAIADVACQAARDAGAVIRRYTGGEVAVQHKEGGDSLASQVVTEVDLCSQNAILDRLKSTTERYDLGLLTEELSDDGSRFSKDYFWCIDPLDGTLPFTQGKAGYAVSIALVGREGQSVVGVAYDPVKDKLYRAVSGQGLRINGQSFVATKASPEQSSSIRFCMDCTFETDPNRAGMTAQLTKLAERMGYPTALIEIQGGAVCNACYALEHSPAVYLKVPKPESGGGSFWDFAATACIFQEAGAAVSDYSGKVLDLNSRTHTFFNHCGVCFSSNLDLAKAIQSAL
jgi:3'(2'), 5'-bisphosphate nucleotidase/myo-inositol-1(or 4)-monophosphatase